MSFINWSPTENENTDIGSPTRLLSQIYLAPRKIQARIAEWFAQAYTCHITSGTADELFLTTSQTNFIISALARVPQAIYFQPHLDVEAGATMAAGTNATAYPFWRAVDVAIEQGDLKEGRGYRAILTPSIDDTSQKGWLVIGLEEDFGEDLLGEATLRIAQDNLLRAADAAETAAREAADEAETAARVAAIAAEAAAREAADAAETAARTAADEAEADARTAADNVLQANIDAEMNARIAAIAQEVVDRNNAIAAYGNVIGVETITSSMSDKAIMEGASRAIIEFSGGGGGGGGSRGSRGDSGGNTTITINGGTTYTAHGGAGGRSSNVTLHGLPANYGWGGELGGTGAGGGEGAMLRDGSRYADAAAGRPAQEKTILLHSGDFPIGILLGAGGDGGPGERIGGDGNGGYVTLYYLK